jgi:hypothetical protein
LIMPLWSAFAELLSLAVPRLTQNRKTAQGELTVRGMTD